ncbi:MAG TPA: phosphoribosylglycinamide formyltransferase, partial [Burkholderiales bacterium]|nr:phosphoribosylglycinamide formyltransferase [Burkholderiales bacterium]
MKRIVILISGRGSNMAAILDAGIQVAAVISNRSDSEGLEIAKARGIPAIAVEHVNYDSREAFDSGLSERIDEFSPDLVILAGFMRILGDDFVKRYTGRLINIHPSLLPSFPGTKTHRKALEKGVRIHGCTVHFV